MIRLTAEWILPIAGQPVRGGFIAIDRGRILAAGPRAPSDAVSLGRVAILPALVNAHTHLELSHLHERIPPSERLDEWIRALMALRRRVEDPTGEAIASAARKAIDEARASGTGIVGDVSNSLASVRLLRDAGMPGYVFHELTGFNVADPEEHVRQARARIDAEGIDKEGVRVSIAPHAPYSVSAALFMAIRTDLDRHPGVCSVHLGESGEEVEFLQAGTGPIRTMLEQLGVWTETWRLPGTSPVQYLSSLGFLDHRVLVVHGVQFGQDDLDRLQGTGATLVSCPRSNHYVGAGPPPIEAFYSAGVPVAFGTDSLASVKDLNLFAELAEARRLAPKVPPRCLLESATLVGARALGFGGDYGSIEEGKRASLIAVRVPEGVDDVEEYLVSGVEPEAIVWLDESLRT